MRATIALICLLPLFAVAEEMPPGEPAPQFFCDPTKKYCKQMESCAEAHYYLAHCGRKHFDRDRDGVPCENVCGDKK